MLHSIPAGAPFTPCFTLGRAARGPFTVGYAAFASGDGRPLEHRLLPLTLPVLILDFDTGAALLTGPRTRASLDGPTSWTRGVSIGLTLVGAAALSRMPLSEISGQTVPLAIPWASRLADLPSWSARFAWLDAVFRPTAAQPPAAAARGYPSVAAPGRWQPSAAVTEAWWCLQTASRVADVAAALGLTRRHLERAFHRDLGLSPGAVSRTARLQRSLTALLHGGRPSAAAQSGGFADQPHLTRTMRDLVGLTPAAFRALVQDAAPQAHLPSGA
jgi:AraC-like DNA-binding protein